MKTANVLQGPTWTAAPSGNGSGEVLQESLQEGFWSKAKNILPHRERILMADGRQIKSGIVIHPIVATALLAILGTLALSIRSEMNWQHDQIIVIATQKADAAETLKAEKQERANEKALRESTDEAWRTNMKVELAQIREQLKKKERN